MEFVEGAAMQVVVNRYERDRQARQAALRLHGCRCQVCGLDMAITTDLAVGVEIAFASCGASLKKSEAHNRCVPTVHKPHATLPVAWAHTLLLIPRLASLPAVTAIGR